MKQDNVQVEINTQEDILKEVKTFYKNIYNAKTNVHTVELGKGRKTFTIIVKLNNRIVNKQKAK